MHYANLKTSERLQDVNELLSDGEWHSTLDIIRGCHVCAVSSIVSELRRNGKVVHCKRVGNVWFYKQEKFSMNKQQITTRVDPVLLREVRAIAKAHDTSFTAIAEGLLWKFVKKTRRMKCREENRKMRREWISDLTSGRQGSLTPGAFGR